MAISFTLCTENVLTYVGCSKKAKTPIRNMYQGRKWLPKSGGASSNTSSNAARRRPRGTFYSAKKYSFLQR